jgi:hypothetical protein
VTPKIMGFQFDSNELAGFSDHCTRGFVAYREDSITGLDAD